MKIEEVIKQLEQEDRDFVGIEINPNYCEIIKQRLNIYAVRKRFLEVQG